MDCLPLSSGTFLHAAARLCFARKVNVSLSVDSANLTAFCVKAIQFNWITIFGHPRSTRYPINIYRSSLEYVISQGYPVDHQMNEQTHFWEIRLFDLLRNELHVCKEAFGRPNIFDIGRQHRTRVSGNDKENANRSITFGGHRNALAEWHPDFKAENSTKGGGTMPASNKETVRCEAFTSEPICVNRQVSLGAPSLGDSRNCPSASGILGQSARSYISILFRWKEEHPYASQVLNFGPNFTRDFFTWKAARDFSF